MFSRGEWKHSMLLVLTAVTSLPSKVLALPSWAHGNFPATMVATSSQPKREAAAGRFGQGRDQGKDNCRKGAPRNSSCLGVFFHTLKIPWGRPQATPLCSAVVPTWLFTSTENPTTFQPHKIPWMDKWWPREDRFRLRSYRATRSWRNAALHPMHQRRAPCHLLSLLPPPSQQHSYFSPSALQHYTRGERRKIYCRNVLPQLPPRECSGMKQMQLPQNSHFPKM